MTTLSRRRFILRLPLAVLSAALPATALAQGYPYEPEQPAITTDSLNKRLLFLENERIFADITVKWLQYNVNLMMKCFRGCGMAPRQKYRI